MGRGVSGRETIAERITRIINSKNIRIDLENAPLEYTNRSMLPKAVRKVVEQFEERYRDSDIEHACLVDKKGNVVAEAEGNRKSVETNSSDWEKATVYTHNHVNEPGIIGGTFSETDFFPFVAHPNVITMRATATEGTYSITKGRRFDAIGFQRYYHNARKPLRDRLNSNIATLNSKALQGTLSEEHYNAQFNRLYNEYLVRLHNILLAGRKKFGYTYGLEWR